MSITNKLPDRLARLPMWVGLQLNIQDVIKSIEKIILTEN
jgi:hypothetical protein